MQVAKDFNKLEIFIPYEEFLVNRLLRGSDFGIFKDAIWKACQKKVALLFPKEKNQFSKEDDLLSKLKELKHDNIIKFHGITYGIVQHHDISNYLFNKIPYQDPRLLKNARKLPDKESDIYSLGFILWRIFSHDEPFSNYDKNLIDLVNEIHQNKREKPTIGTPKHYISIYETCWSFNLNERPPIKHVLIELKKI
ncbi:15384_t:CDS:2 [Gigaspora margarita]|uniref:15384_t:CDS:1 n=1 Tax=Gigaspora margarita TaxID=4874 RepID=A0ABN7UGW5_GIGMA|nr:15384_t:CDS:2 [Gigaspora margarita]